MFSKTLAKKTLAVSASLALAIGGALAMTGSASAAGSAVALTFGDGDTYGTNAAVAAFEGASSAIDDAPAAAGVIGGDGKALKINKTGNAWSGANLLVPAMVDTALDNKITVDYFNGGTAAEPVMMKVQEGTWPNEGGSSKKAVEAAPGWNRLTFNMATGIGYDAAHVYKVAAIFPNFSADDTAYAGAAPGPMDSVYYIDNVRFNGGVAVSGPSKKVLKVYIANPLGQRVSVRIPGVRTWKSSTVGSTGIVNKTFTVPSGTYKVTVTVGSQSFVKTQVVK